MTRIRDALNRELLVGDLIDIGYRDIFEIISILSNDTELPIESSDSISACNTRTGEIFEFKFERLNPVQWADALLISHRKEPST